MRATCWLTWLGAVSLLGLPMALGQEYGPSSADGFEPFTPFAPFEEFEPFADDFESFAPFERYPDEVPSISYGYYQRAGLYDWFYDYYDARPYTYGADGRSYEPGIPFSVERTYYTPEYETPPLRTPDYVGDPY